MLLVAITLAVVALVLAIGSAVYSRNNPREDFPAEVGICAIGLFLFTTGALVGIWLG